MSNQPKTIKSYKISPELKEKLENLAAASELGTQEDFIAELVDLYERHQFKEGNTAYAKEISEIDYHSKRVGELFRGLIETEGAARLQLTQGHDEQRGRLTETIQAQELTIQELQQDKKTQAAEIAQIRKEHEASSKLAEQLQASVQDKAALVEEYRERIDTLSGLVNEYKAAADRNKELTDAVSRLKSREMDQAQRIIALEASASDLKAAGEFKQADDARRAQEAIERLQERLDVERERAVLAVRTEYAGKLEDSNTDFLAQIRGLYDRIHELEKEKAGVVAETHDLQKQIHQLQQSKGGGDQPKK